MNTVKYIFKCVGYDFYNDPEDQHNTFILN